MIKNEGYVFIRLELERREYKDESPILSDKREDAGETVRKQAPS